MGTPRTALVSRMRVVILRRTTPTICTVGRVGEFGLGWKGQGCSVTGCHPLPPKPKCRSHNHIGGMVWKFQQARTRTCSGAAPNLARCRRAVRALGSQLCSLGLKEGVSPGRKISSVRITHLATTCGLATNTSSRARVGTPFLKVSACEDCF